MQVTCHGCYSVSVSLVEICEALEDHNHHGHVVTANTIAPCVLCQTMVTHALRYVLHALALKQPVPYKGHCLQTSTIQDDVLETSLSIFQATNLKAASIIAI